MNKKKERKEKRKREKGWDDYTMLGAGYT